MPAPSVGLAEPATLASLLPPAPEPISLRHARALAVAGDYPSAAAVYSALAAETPDDARLIGGRGYCLIYVEGGAALAAADLAAARSLARGDGRLRGVIEHNILLLEERTGVRVPPASDEGRDEPDVVCPDHAERIPPLHANTLVQVAEAIVTEARETWQAGAIPEVDAELVSAMVEGAEVSRPFLAFLAPQGSQQYHLVLPTADGFTIFPRVTALAWSDGRCGQSMSPPEIVERDGVFRVRSFATYSEEMEVCDDDGENCMTGCGFTKRTDVEALVRTDGSAGVRIVDDETMDGRSLDPLASTVSRAEVTATVCDRPMRFAW